MLLPSACGCMCLKIAAPIPDANLMPGKLVERLDYRQRIAFVVKKSSSAQTAGYGRFPPKNTETPTLGDVQD